MKSVSEIKVLAIDTSSDETSAAITQGVRVLSNIIWSQASLHAQWGGIFPTLAQREHRKRIDWVINKAITSAGINFSNIDAIAVTVGPGLAIALEVGILKAKEISKKYKKPIIAVNHIEGHLLSPLAIPKNRIIFNKDFKLKSSSIAFIASGGTTMLVLIKNIGEYEIIAETLDDALGEALDKGARMLGLGYPGGSILEKMAKEGSVNTYELPIPMQGREVELKFSYSGLKTAFYRLIEKEKPLNAKTIKNLAACYQNTAFIHVENLLSYSLKKYPIKEFLFGGGVSSNLNLRKRIRTICKKNNILLRLPYSKKLCTDNAAMIGIAGYFKYQKGETIKVKDIDKIDRQPRAQIGKPFSFLK
jgi:N6-L-threonylcarbamoyladenine synthase